MLPLPVSNIIPTWSPENQSQDNPRYITSFNPIKVLNMYILVPICILQCVCIRCNLFRHYILEKTMKTNTIIVILVHTYGCMFCASRSWSSVDSSGDYNYNVGFCALNCIFEGYSWRVVLSLWSDYSYTIPNSV